MKIAFLAHSFGRFGGREIQTAALVSELNFRGHIADIFHSGQEFPATIESMVCGHYKKLPLGIKDLRSVFELLRRLAKYDRIVNMGCEPLLAFMIVLLFPRKTVFYANSPLEVEWSEKITGIDYRILSKTFNRSVFMFYGRLGSILIRYRPTYMFSIKLIAAIDKLSLGLYHSIWAVSKFSAEQIEATYGLPPKTVRTIYHMVRPDLLYWSRLDTQNDAGSYVLAVGALVPEKNLTLLLDAVGKLPTRVRVVIAGQGPEKERLEFLAKSLGIDLSIKLAKNGRELASLYNDALVLVQPSLYECMSMVPVEAALFGKPTIIVNSRYSGNREVVVDGVTGFALESADASLLSQKLAFLLDNPGERKRLGWNARNAISKPFMPTIRVDELTEALDFE